MSGGGLLRSQPLSHTVLSDVELRWEHSAAIRNTVGVVIMHSKVCYEHGTAFCHLTESGCVNNIEEVLRFVSLQRK